MTMTEREIEIWWLMKNSEGIKGLNLDGTVMPWAEVVDKYMPSWHTAVAPTPGLEE